MITKSRLKNILSLKRRKIRNEKKLFLIEGYRLCQEALQSEFIVETLLISPEMLSPQKFDTITQSAQNSEVEILEIEKPEMKQLADTVHSQGVFCVGSKNMGLTHGSFEYFQGIKHMCLRSLRIFQGKFHPGKRMKNIG